MVAQNHHVVVDSFWPKRPTRFGAGAPPPATAEAKTWQQQRENHRCWDRFFNWRLGSDRIGSDGIRGSGAGRKSSPEPKSARRGMKSCLAGHNDIQQYNIILQYNYICTYCNYTYTRSFRESLCACNIADTVQGKLVMKQSNNAGKCLQRLTFFCSFQC